MGTFGPAGNADQDSPCVHVPMGRPQSGERRHHIHPAGVRHLTGIILRIGRFPDKPHLIPKPLNNRAAGKNAAFQCVTRFCAIRSGNCCDQPVFALDRLGTGVHQQKAPGSICIFDLPFLPAALAKKRRLLVTCNAGDRNGYPVDMGITETSRRRQNLRQHRRRYPQPVENLLIPAAGMNIKHHRPGSVGVIGREDLPARQLPHQPGVYRPKTKLPFFRPLPRTRNLIENPGNLGRREIGVNQQTCRLADILPPALFFQLFAQWCCPAALPNNCVIDRAASALFPNNRRLPLIGDPDGGDLLRFNPCQQHRVDQYAILGRVNFHRVMLHPAFMRVILGILPLGNTDNLLIMVENHCTGTSRPLVKGYHILFIHDLSPSLIKIPVASVLIISNSNG